VSRDAKSQWNGRMFNGIDRSGNVRGKDLRATEFLVTPMSSKPYFAEGTLFGENNLGIKHNEESVSLCEREREREFEEFEQEKWYKNEIE
jgi:hypothetical protein